METVRYALALLVVATFPGAIVVWLLLHGLLPVWRRVGPGIAYVLFASVMVGSAVVLFLLRAPLMAVDLGSSPWTMAAALVIYAVAAALELRCWKHLTLRTLVGLPELKPRAGEQPLLQTGIYGRLRHPRYTALLLGLVAVALFTGYLAVYGLVVVSSLGLYLVTVLEERELVDRFGQAYVEYRRRVPRFVPRLR